MEKQYNVSMTITVDEENADKDAYEIQEMILDAMDEVPIQVDCIQLRG